MAIAHTGHPHISTYFYTNYPGSVRYIWARLAARLYTNQPSPVTNVCGYAVRASRMIPSPSL